ELAAGDAIGPYRLLSELGSGGMGAVWLAERADGALNRQVALKLPRMVWAKGLAERMARERDILATLEHPNIARLYDAGVDQHGRPYLALEYVEGRPIDVYVKERGLSVRHRLELLLQVCAAVAFAHSRLVVHRDLKPSNILVTADGQVRLLDFGIAKLMEGDSTRETQLTQLAGRALTLDYASPEQVRGEPLSTASDVYSLGVVSYELLTGTRPYRLKRGSAAELEEAIEQSEPALASRAAIDAAPVRVLRGDLDAILNQALKKSIKERYRSVEALADDWQRWLRDEPVAARPDSAVYRLRKFVRRHRAQVAAAALVTFALIGGTGASLWQAQRADSARLLAEHEATTARAVQGFLESVFLSNRGDQALPAAGRQATARDLLDRGAQRITTELQDQPKARLRLLEVLSGLYEDLGELERMRELSELRLAQAELMPPAERDRERVRALTDLAHALAIGGREVDARARLDEAEALLERAGLEEVPLRLRLLVRRGSVHRADDPARAASAAEQALALAGTLPPSVDGVLAAYLVGESRATRGEPDGAVSVIREAVTLVERRPELGASILAPLHTLLGDAEFARGRTDAAEASYRRGIEVERARGGSGVLPHLLTVQFGRFLIRQERWREAAEAIAPTWDWARGQTAGYETTVPMASVTQGEALVGMGRLDEGLAALDLAVEQVSRLQDAADIAPGILAARATAWVRVQRLTDAEQALADIDAKLARRSQPSPRSVEQARRALQVARGRAQEAVAGWRAERAASGRAEVPDASTEPAALVEWAQLLLASGQHGAAHAHATSAIAAFDARQAAGQPWRGATLAQAWRVAGVSAEALGRPRDALQALQRAAALLRPEVDTSRSADLAELLTMLAKAAERAGQPQQAADARREARAIAATGGRV
ncbi:MAG: protein kinase domain-containing protein, partial [Telluria sp.]